MAHQPTERSRLYITIPADDPRFADLRAVIAAVRQRGKHRPVPRMLAEWALIGFLVTTGRMAIGKGASPAITLPDDLPDPDQVLAYQQEVAEAVAEFGFE